MNSRTPRIVQVLREGPSGSLLIFGKFHVDVDATGRITPPLERLVVTPQHAYSMKRTAMWQSKDISRAGWKRLSAINPRKMAGIIQRALNRHIIDHRIAAATRRISPWYTPVETYNLLAEADQDMVERILKDDLHAAAIYLAGRGQPDRKVLLDPWTILQWDGFNRRHVEQLISLPHSLRQVMLDRQADDNIIRNILDNLDHYPWIRNISREYARIFLTNIEPHDDISGAAKSIEKSELFFNAIADWTGLMAKENKEQKKRAENIIKAVLRAPHQPLSRDFRDLRNRLKIVWQLTSHNDTPWEELVEATVHPTSTARKFGMTLGEWKRVAPTMMTLCNLYIYRKNRLIMPKGPELGRALLQLVKTHGARRVKKAIRAHCPSDNVSCEEDILRFIDIWCAAQPADTGTGKIEKKMSLIARVRDITDMNQALALLRHPHPQASSQALTGPLCGLDNRRSWSLPRARPGQKFIIGRVQDFHNRVHIHTSHQTLLRLKAFSSRLKSIAALEDRGLTTRSITHDGGSCIIHDGERIHAILRRPKISPCLTISLQRHRTHLAITGGKLDTPLAEIASAIDSITPEHALPPKEAHRAIDITAILTAMMSQKKETKPADLVEHPAVQTLHEAGVVLAVGAEDLFVGDSCAMTACAEHIKHKAWKLGKLSTSALLQAMHEHMNMEGSGGSAMLSAGSAHPGETGNMECAFD